MRTKRRKNYKLSSYACTDRGGRVYSDVLKWKFRQGRRMNERDFCAEDELMKVCTTSRNTTAAYWLWSRANQLEEPNPGFLEGEIRKFVSHYMLTMISMARGIGTPKPTEADIKRARHWIMSDCDDPFTLLWCCEVLQFTAKRIAQFRMNFEAELRDNVVLLSF